MGIEATPLIPNGNHQSPGFDPKQDQDMLSCVQPVPVLDGVGDSFPHRQAQVLCRAPAQSNHTAEIFRHFLDQVDELVTAVNLNADFPRGCIFAQRRLEGTLGSSPVPGAESALDFRRHKAGHASRKPTTESTRGADARDGKASGIPGDYWTLLGVTTGLKISVPLAVSLTWTEAAASKSSTTPVVSSWATLNWMGTSTFPDSIFKGAVVPSW